MASNPDASVNFEFAPTPAKPGQFDRMVEGLYMNEQPNAWRVDRSAVEKPDRDHLVSYSKGIEGVLAIAMRIIRGDGTDADAVTVAKTLLELEDPEGLAHHIAEQDRKISIEELFKNTVREILKSSAGSNLDLTSWCGGGAGVVIWDHPFGGFDSLWVSTLPVGAIVASTFRGHDVPTILWTSPDRHPDRHIDVLLSPEDDGNAGIKMSVRLVQHHQALKFTDPSTGKSFYGMRPNPGGRATESLGGDRGSLVRALFYAGMIPESRGAMAVQNADPAGGIDAQFLKDAGFMPSVEYSRKYGWKPTESLTEAQGATYIQRVQTYDKISNTRTWKIVEVTLSRPRPNLEWVLRHANGVHINAKKGDVLKALSGNDTNIPNMSPADFKRPRI